jgi:3-oxoacyl-[acyl-carrier-protein] synthase-1
MKVVVTGIGIWSCLGTNINEVTQSLKTGKSGIGIDISRLDYGYHSPLTGIVERPQLKGLIDRRMRAGMSEQAEYAYMASREALAMAGLSSPDGIIFGNDTSAKAVVEAHEVMKTHCDSEFMGAGNIFQSMTSTVTMNLSNIFQVKGINLTVSSACASGSHAIGIAATIIRHGMQDVILCGGAQEVNMYAMSSFDALGVFSHQIEDPHKASCPFDRDRQGLVPSGGAAALVLESYDHATKRGATILAEVAGYGFSSNGGGKLSTPSCEGSLLAMQRALDDAHITADQIDYVNAHATGTPQGDLVEAQALNQLFCGHKAWISSTKSMTGHECWMAGASEAVYSIIMMQGGFIAPNINLKNPDEESAKMRIATSTLEVPVDIVLSNSFGFGGTNSALVLRR